MLRNRIFDAEERPLEIFNGVAIIDLPISFFTEECDEEEDFTFPSFSSGYFRVFNERLGRELKDLTLTRSGNELILNASVSDMTFEDNGRYYYEIGYIASGGYEFPLRYGVATVI